MDVLFLKFEHVKEQPTPLSAVPLKGHALTYQ